MAFFKNFVEVELINSVEGHLDELSELLIKTVEEGASIGFMPPMENQAAIDYWSTVPEPNVLLFIAKMNEVIVGSVQLHFSLKENGTHRAEIAKLMTHPSCRRGGIGRLLMHKAEEAAKVEGKTLIVLDTREGDPSNNLYLSLGYTRGGRIPSYCRSTDGQLAATIFYYKILT